MVVQTKRGKAQDKKKTAKKILKRTPENIKIWRLKKNKLDLEGVDTKQNTKKSSKAKVKKSKKSVGGKSTSTITQKAQQFGKLSKTKKAYNIIRADYAKHGKDTGSAMRAYIENKISYTKYQELAKSGLRIFNKK